MRQLSHPESRSSPIFIHQSKGNSMSTESCTCSSCSTATLVGSEAVGLCTSCGSLSLAGTAVPLIVVVLATLAVRALILARRGPRTPLLAARMRVVSA